MKRVFNRKLELKTTHELLGPEERVISSKDRTLTLHCADGGLSLSYSQEPRQTASFDEQFSFSLTNVSANQLKTGSTFVTDTIVNRPRIEKAKSWSCYCLELSLLKPDEDSITGDRLVLDMLEQGLADDQIPQHRRYVIDWKSTQAFLQLINDWHTV